MDSRNISFLLNGERVHVANAQPTDLLIDYLRSPAVNLTGTKLSCGEGGCGACTVLLSYFDFDSNQYIHTPVNACLRPLCSLDGTSVTTVEGTNRPGLTDPVKDNMVKSCASQCGYCSPGFVMAMHGLLRKQPRPEPQAIEDQFAGNICRCTGYISILKAMHKTGEELRATPSRMQTEPPQPEDFQPFTSFSISSRGYQYFRPTTIEETLQLLKDLGDRRDEIKLVQGNTSIGIYKRDVEDPHLLIDVSKLKGFRWIRTDEQGGITMGGAATIAMLLDHLDNLAAAGPMNTGLSALRDHVRLIAGAQVRGAASVAGSLMLVKNHELRGTPFPGDLFTVLSLLKATVTLLTPDGEEQSFELLQFPPLDTLKGGFLITRITIPASPEGTVVKTFRVARRAQNSHPIVNAGFSCALDRDLHIQDIRLVYGGIGRIALAMTDTQQELTESGLAWGPDLLQRALPALRAEIEKKLVLEQEPIFSKAFLCSLAVNGFYKFYINVCDANGIAIDEADRSAGTPYLRPIAQGKHDYLLAPFFDGTTGKLNDIVHMTEKRQVLGAPVKPAIQTAAFKQVIRETSSNIVLKQLSPQPTSFFVEEKTKVPDKKATAKALELVEQKLQTKIDAHIQVDGTAKYTHDLEYSADTLQGYYVYSMHRNAYFTYMLSMDDLRRQLSERFPGARYIHEGDIPRPVQDNKPEPSYVYDPANPESYDPIFAQNVVACYGMPIGLVVAPDTETARAGAEFIQGLITYDPLPEDKTFATFQDAIDKNSIIHTNARNSRIPFIYRPIPDSDPQKLQKMNWMNEPQKEEGYEYVQGKQETGAQYHFYMEPQGCLAIPREDGQIELHSSTQNQSSVQKNVAKLLQLSIHDVKVAVTRLGGGFGGKELRQVYVAGAAAVAAWTLKRPVRLMLNRNIDMRMMGLRHPFQGDYYLSATKEGRIEKMRVDYRSDGGISYDCSFPVMDLALLCAENAYFVETFKTKGDVYRTNIQSHTAFRSFGLVQSMLITETALEHLAFQLKMRPDVLRALNFYRDGQAVGDKPQYTPYGSPLPYCRINQVWKDFKEKIDFEDRLKAVDEFNRNNRWRKRGLSIIPLKYGISYTYRPMNQGSAYVFAYKEDGSVLLHHGGVEMGQGMHTKMAQIAAQELGINIDSIRIASTSTSVIPNVSSTGASTGSDLNGYAVRRACQKLKAILGAFLNDVLLDEDHTKYPDTHVDSDTVRNYLNNMGANWAKIVSLAATARISLSAQYSFASPQLGSIPTTPRENYQITPVDSQIFFYYNYCVAASEVEIDVLTGQFEILRSDLVYDAGDSLNDNIDYGQVEGGFIQGVGCLTTEEMLYAADGRVISDGTWEYKPPCTKTIPQEFNVYLLKYVSSGIKTDPPKDYYGIQSSKSTGEPPLVLANTVFFAIRQAVQAARADAGNKEWFPFTAPATVQKIQTACLSAPAYMTEEMMD